MLLEMEKNTRNFGEMLKGLREARGLTLQRLADLAELSQDRVWRAEQEAKSTMRRSNAIRLYEALNSARPLSPIDRADFLAATGLDHVMEIANAALTESRLDGEMPMHVVREARLAYERVGEDEFVARCRQMRARDPLIVHSAPERVRGLDGKEYEILVHAPGPVMEDVRDEIKQIKEQLAMLLASHGRKRRA